MSSDKGDAQPTGATNFEANSNPFNKVADTTGSPTSDVQPNAASAPTPNSSQQADGQLGHVPESGPGSATLEFQEGGRYERMYQFTYVGTLCAAPMMLMATVFPFLVAAMLGDKAPWTHLIVYFLGWSVWNINCASIFLPWSGVSIEECGNIQMHKLARCINYGVFAIFFVVIGATQIPVPSPLGMGLLQLIVCAVGTPVAMKICAKYLASQNVQLWNKEGVDIGMKMSDATFLPVLAIGLGVGFGYSYSIQFNATLAASALSFGLSAAEIASQTLVVGLMAKAPDGWTADNMSGLLWNSQICAEGLRLGALIVGFWTSPLDASGYLQSLAFTCVLNILGRSGWTKHLMYKATGKEMFLPDIALLTWNAQKFTTSYGRYVLPAALMFLQIILDSPFKHYTYLSYMMFLLATFVFAVVEDLAVWSFEKFKLDPRLPQAAHLHYQHLDRTEAHLKAYTVSSDGKLEVSFQQPKYSYFFHVFSFTLCLGGCIDGFGYVAAPMLSIQFLTGFSGEPLQTSDDGWVLWSKPFSIGGP